MPVELTLRYDKVSDVLYIKLKGDIIADSDEISPGIIVDYGRGGEVTGAEILWFSTRGIDLKKLVVEGLEALMAIA
jgi:uncharacterized protein YuzE